ncbi:MAG TPA: hypothetical protein VLZ89_00230 [Anaerolineales bacterium]|nr:hypothetical protein [Anaerolineales bacterium]
MTRSNANPASRINVIAFYASIMALFVVVHLTQDILQSALQGPWLPPALKFAGTRSNIVLTAAPAFKAFVFLLCVSIVCLPLLGDLFRKVGSLELAALGRAILTGLGAALILSLLGFCLGNDGMGLNYARISERPFDQDSTEYSTRLFLPALAYILHLRGFWPYYAFFVCLTIGFIALLQIWNEENAHLNFWQFISLCTSSFVIFQFEIPGYPDILVFIFFILVMQRRLASRAKLSLLILALITHESSMLIAVLLAWRYLQRKDFITYLGAVIIYGVIWLTASGFSLSPILASHEVAGRSTLAWLLQAPLQEIIGILVAYKALWIFLIIGIVLAFRQRLFADALFMLGCVIGGLVLTVFGVDTSRLMGYAFPGLLLAIATIRSAPGRMGERAASLIFAVNLCIPSFDSVLSSGAFSAPGLYALLYSWLRSLLGFRSGNLQT